jgi:hypothetical protein
MGSSTYPTPPIPAIATRRLNEIRFSISAIIPSRPTKLSSFSNGSVEIGCVDPVWPNAKSVRLGYIEHVLD